MIRADLGQQIEAFVAQLVATGRYNSKSEVPRYEPHGIRHRVHRGYLIVYRIEAERLVVIHIVRGAMDYAAILSAS